MWYSENTEALILPVSATKNRVTFIVEGVLLFYTDSVRDFKKTSVFAPGVADLLRELGLEYDISTIGSQYIVIRRNHKDETVKDWVNDNPAEALAAAWLEAHES